MNQTKLAVMKAGSNCCQLPLKRRRRRIQEVTVSLASANTEISTEKGRIFTIKEEQRLILRAFLFYA